MSSQWEYLKRPAPIGLTLASILAIHGMRHLSPLHRRIRALEHHLSFGTSFPPLSPDLLKTYRDIGPECLLWRKNEWSAYSESWQQLERGLRPWPPHQEVLDLLRSWLK